MIAVRWGSRGVRLAAVVCLVLFAFRFSNAQISAWPVDGPAFSATPGDIQAAAAKIAAEKFADATVLMEEQKYVIDGSGRVTGTHHLIYRIESPAAVESWSEVSEEWEQFYQDAPSIRARVIEPSGEVVELDQKTVTDVAAEDRGDGTLSDDRVHKAPLPALKVGSIVEEETQSIDKEAYFASGGVYREYFQRNVPVVRTRLVVEVPAKAALQYRVGFLPEIVTKDETGGEVRRLTFDQGHLGSWVNSDIDLATHAPRLPWVEFSTGASWQTVAGSYAAMAEPQIQPDAVKSLLPASGKRDEMTTIAVLVAALHREVRYTGVEFGKARLEPQVSAEILRRHYGDCKDKASLLVAMLRAAGIGAHLALLDAGPGPDVTPELPGINRFDHAIVYVPAAQGRRALWIDATAEFTKVGDLPYPDQGRQALIIAKETQGLTLTPEARPEDSVLTETREFFLADYGPAHIVESSETSGYIDANYRSWYGGPESKETKTTLENYVRGAYLAKALTGVEHGDAGDFTKPFTLKLDVAQGTRGNTSVSDAAVALTPIGTYGDLPHWFAVDPHPGSEKPTAEEEANRARAEAQRSSEYDIQPFITHRKYRIVPSEGFAVRGLPESKTVAMGPASLTESYAVDGKGVVTADFTFTTGKSRYTQDEVLALRTAVLEQNKADATVVTFDQTGAKLLAAGKTREALATDRALIAAHPKDAVHHVRMAYALLEAGVGDEAQGEAKKAVDVDTKSALAWSTEGWALQFNSIGVQHGAGFDLKGALDAYRKAKALDPDNEETRVNLAILYEFDAAGERYAADADLNQAIAEYRELKKQNKEAGERYEDNQLFCLLYAHRFKEVLAEAAGLPSSPVRSGLSIAATVASEGVEAGLKRADQVSGGAEQRADALTKAGGELIRLRMYPEAAQVLSAGLQGQENAGLIARQVELFRNLKPYDPQQESAADATAVVRKMLADTMSGSLSEGQIARWLARHAYATDEEWKKNLKKGEEAMFSLRVVAERAGTTMDVIRDTALGAMKVSTQGDDATGYRITIQTPGMAPRRFFVTKEDGAYRIVASQEDFLEVGNEALYLLHHGDEQQARSLLDWKRDQMHKGGGDDPLSGPLLPRFWTSGETKGADAIELAAASLLVGQADITAMLPELAQKAAATGLDKSDPAGLDLLLADGWLHAEDSTHAKPAIDALLAGWPDSYTALALAGEEDRLTKNWAGWNARVDAHLAKHPGDRILLLQKAEAQQAQGDFAGARKTLKQELNGGEANAEDYNNYAWNALFEHNVDEDAIQAGQQATTLSNNARFADLHTLACLYAAEGKTTEARQVLLQAMQAEAMAEPNSAAWFAFGAIYEQYGDRDAAIAALKKVEKPEGPVNPVDTWVLAQEHLKALE